MYNELFRSSKAALLFGGMIIVTAVVLIGSPEDKGVVNKVVDLVGKPSETAAAEPEAASETLTVVETPSETKSRWPKPNWKQNPTALPEYNTSDETPAPDPTVSVPSTGSAPQPVAQARQPGPQPVVGDFEGTVVPGND